jgi:hypothetical protein
MATLGTTVSTTSLPKNNFAATAGPTATDDTAAGYEVGSHWLDTTNDQIWECVDATNSAAIWHETDPFSPLQQRSMQVLVNPGAATVTTVGFAAAPTLTATASNADDADGPYLNHATSGTSGNPSGVVSAFTVCRRDWFPCYTTAIKLDSANVTTSRLWIGLFSASPDASATPAIHLAAFRYDTTADGTAFWRCCTDNASGAPTVATTTVAITANTRYVMRIDCNASPVEVRFYINNILVATNVLKLPTATTLLGYGNRITTLANSARNLKWSRIAITHR